MSVEPFRAAWQMVTCKDCGHHYCCTPFEDYYNATSIIDGLCEPCLLAEAGIGPDKVIDLRGLNQ